MISYDEVLKELEKYRQDHYELTEEEEKLLIEARRIKVPYSKIREVFKDFNVQYCLYGHVHIDYDQTFTGIKDNINYHFVAADYLKFKPKLILEI